MFHWHCNRPKIRSQSAFVADGRGHERPCVYADERRPSDTLQAAHDDDRADQGKEGCEAISGRSAPVITPPATLPPPKDKLL